MRRGYFVVEVRTFAALTQRRIHLETIDRGFGPQPLFRRS